MRVVIGIVLLVLAAWIAYCVWTYPPPACRPVPASDPQPVCPAYDVP